MDFVNLGGIFINFKNKMPPNLAIFIFNTWILSIWGAFLFSYNLVDKNKIPLKQSFFIF
jgi:hypothetical protein